MGSSDEPRRPPDAPGPGDIPVTQPYMPPLEEFLPYLEQIWESKFLTNGGPFHQDFERNWPNTWVWTILPCSPTARSV